MPLKSIPLTQGLETRSNPFQGTTPDTFQGQQTLSDHLPYPNLHLMNSAKTRTHFNCQPRVPQEP